MVLLNLRPGAQHYSEEELAAGLIEGTQPILPVLHGYVDEPGPEIGLHDGVREAHPVPACFHQSEPCAPGRGQPDVDAAPELVEPALQLRDDRRRGFWS